MLGVASFEDGGAMAKWWFGVDYGWYGGYSYGTGSRSSSVVRSCYSGERDDGDESWPWKEDLQ